MALENVTHISDLVQTNPTSTDPASQGDDHIRNIKKALKNTFAAITGAVTASHTELNYVNGVTSSIQTQLNNLGTRITNEIADAVTAITGRSIVAGNGLTGGGALDQSRTLTLGTPSNLSATSTNSVTSTSHTHAIDSTIARSDRKITAGDGLSGGGDLTADRSLAVDGTVVRTSGAQTVGGVKNFSNGIDAAGTMDLYAAPATSFGLIFRDNNASGPLRGQLHSQNDRSISLRVYDAAGNNTGDLTVSPTGVASASGGFSGVGTSLTNLNASNIDSGTLADARLPSTAVRTSRSITAGNGLTGGGDLSANLTLTLGTPGSITGSSTNSVTATSHTHLLDLGSLVNKSGASSDNESRLIYINGTDNNSIARIGEAELRAGFNLAAGTRNIAAGNGLTGGGDLTANRTIALGTPSSITATSTNSVTSTSHTHALGEAAVRTLISDGGLGQVGTYAFMANVGILTQITPGTTVSGSNLRYSDNGLEYSSITPSGTWRCMGFARGSGSSSSARSTLFLRIS